MNVVTSPKRGQLKVCTAKAMIVEKNNTMAESVFLFGTKGGKKVHKSYIALFWCVVLVHSSFQFISKGPHQNLKHTPYIHKHYNILVFMFYDSRHTWNAPHTGHTFLQSISNAYLFVMSVHLLRFVQAKTRTPTNQKRCNHKNDKENQPRKEHDL